ncbi:MAG TPA: ABC transporter ATP-binding protein [Terriglobales bacterium]|nr:ABC transporter ATP-binding protein [Terriglobales bacterium]
MSDAVIQVEKLGKRFHIGKLQGATTLRDAFTDAVKRPFRRCAEDEDTILWALRDVSFEVKEGEVVGLIGRNGAGKSTLLKILSRITRPTKGSAQLKGRIGSLLEVGTGFHPELSGRENVFLSGAILGMKKSEIQRKFDEIVAFSEVERFLDTPLKHYSSGMQTRLAFSVAAHLEPEILLVDEVLAVGDVTFQKKCLGKMQDVAEHGRTIVFVSHNPAAVMRLCNRSLVLSGGSVAFNGDTRTAISRYYMPSVSGEKSGRYIAPVRSREEAHVISANVLGASSSSNHEHGKPLVFEFDVFVPSPRRELCFSFQVVNEDSVAVCHFWFLSSDRPFGGTPGTHRLRCTVPYPRLFMGAYTLTTWLSDRQGTEHLLERLEGICPFRISMGFDRDQYDWNEGECAYIEDGIWDVVKPTDGNAPQLHSTTQSAVSVAND